MQICVIFTVIKNDWEWRFIQLIKLVFFLQPDVESPRLLMNRKSFMNHLQATRVELNYTIVSFFSSHLRIASQNYEAVTTVNSFHSCWNKKGGLESTPWCVLCRHKFMYSLLSLLWIWVVILISNIAFHSQSISPPGPHEVLINITKY